MSGFESNYDDVLCDLLKIAAPWRPKTTPMSADWKERLLPKLRKELEKRPDLIQLREKILSYSHEKVDFWKPPNRVKPTLVQF
jgi:hypothetical protein